MSDERSRPVRKDDAFDVQALSTWLSENVDGVSGTPSVRQFSAGASNLTYLLQFDERALVLRRPPAGGRSGTAHDMAREYSLQLRLRPHFAYTPEVLALCEDDAVLGSTFYVMEHIDGVIPGAQMPAEIGTEPTRMAAIAERFVELFAELHAIDVTTTGLEELGRGRGYVARQVAQWSERFRRAHTSNVPDFERVMEWLDANQPPDVGYCMIHNDFRLDNMVFDRTEPLQIKGVLDWELATIGDPMMDMASSLPYWIEPGDGRIARQFKRQPTDLPGFPTRRELAGRYSELTGISLDAWAFYEVFGVFRLAVIAQQIYQRYRSGQSTNSAFRFYWVGVRAAHKRCANTIKDAR